MNERDIINRWVANQRSLQRANRESTILDTEYAQMQASPDGRCGRILTVDEYREERDKIGQWRAAAEREVARAFEDACRVVDEGSDVRELLSHVTGDDVAPGEELAAIRRLERAGDR